MNNNSCPRQPNAIVSITLTIHAHNSAEAIERVEELLRRGLQTPAPEEAIAASKYEDLVADYKISEPVWTETIITESEAAAIQSKPGQSPTEDQS